MEHKKLLTLCFIRQGDNILLGMKKRGMGQGKWNGFGGKVEIEETIHDAVIREVKEEAGIVVQHIQLYGVLDFTLPGEIQIWQVHIFLATQFSGEVIETEEMKPKWFAIPEIPYNAMWEDDKYWLPFLLEHKKFRGTFTFDESYRIVTQELTLNTLNPQQVIPFRDTGSRSRFLDPESSSG